MLAKLSHSALDSFRTCPRKFKFEKIEKVKVYQPTPAHLLVGTAVHAQVRKAYDWAANGKLYPLPEMLAGYDKVFEGPNRDKVVPGHEYSTVEEDIARGRDMLEKFYSQYQPFSEGKHLFAEKSFSFHLPDCSPEMTARVDRVWKRDDGVYEIADFKTGKMAGPKDPVFRNQMGFYQLAVAESFPDWTIEVAEYFLRYGEVVRYAMRPDELDELAEQFRAEVHDIARAERTDSWPTKEGGHCNWCDFFQLCPAKRHQKVMEESDDEEAPQGFREAAVLADKYLNRNVEYKRLKTELDALKEDLTTVARELKVSKFQGTTGHVSVTIKPMEKLPSKSNDPQKYVELVSLVRSWDENTRETCLKPDETILMNLYHRGRLAPLEKEALARLIKTSEQITVRAKLNQPIDSEDSEEAEGD